MAIQHDPKAQDLKQRMHFLEKVASLSPNLLFITDLRDRKIVYVNSRVKELLGHDADFVYGQGPEIFKTVVHPDDYGRRLENLEKCRHLGDQEETRVDVRFRVNKNEWQWFKITEKIFEREADGRVVRLIGTAQNIHDQKVYEEKLREEHRRLKNAQAIGHIGSFERELPGDLIRYSEEFYRILGLEPQPEKKFDLEEFLSHVHPDDRETYRAAIDHTHATGEPLDMVTRIVRPDGSVRHVHRRAAIIKNENGAPVRVYGTVQDITERIKAEEDRKKFAGLMYATEKAAGTGSYEASLQTNETYFSDGLFRLFGEEPGSIVPTQEWLDSRSHPEDAAQVRQLLKSAALKKEPYTYTRRIYHTDGRLRILEVQGNVLTDAKGNATKLIGLVQDITERKEAEEELRKSEERSRNLLNVLQHAPDAYLVLKSDFYIKMASDAYLEATHTRREDIVGQYMFDVFPDNPAVADATGVKNLRASLHRVVSSKEPHRMTIQHYDVPLPGGGFEEKYWSPVNTPVINAAGEVEYIIYRVLDVTEVIKKQNALKGLISKTEILKNSLEEIKLQASQLKESRALLQSVFDASPNSIVLYKAIYGDDGGVEDFEFLMVNSFTLSTTGQDKNIIGKRFSDVFPNSIETGILEQFRRTAETGVPADFETWYEGEGMSQWFHIRANKIDAYLVTTIEDITGRKKTEETIRQMLNGSISAITILDSVRDGQGNIIDFVFKGGNKAAEDLNGVSTEELIGKRLLELFPGVKDVFFDIYVKVVEEGKPLRTQRHYEHEHYDHWLDVSAVKNGDGFIMTYHDVTEQKKAEQELLKLKDQLAKRANESEYRFASLVTASSDSVYKMSPDWGTMYNLQGKKFLSDTAGANDSWIEDYIPEPERPRVIEAIRESVRNKSMFELEHQVFDITGNVGWTYSRAIPSLNDEGEVVEWLGVASDITARKKTEERQNLLLKLSDTLRSLTDPEKMINLALKNLGQHLGVDRAYYSEALPDGDTLLTRSGYLKEVPPLPKRIKISDLDTGIREPYLQGKILVLNDSLKDLEPNEEMDKARKEAQIRAAIGVPLVKNENLLAVVGVHQSTPRTWSAEDIALVEEVCERTWAAVERVRAEKALRQAQERLNIAIEAAQMGTWILDMTNSTTERNFRHDQIFGYSSPQPNWNLEIARKHVLPEDQQMFDAAFESAFKTGNLLVEVRVRWQDGSIHWMGVSGHFYFDESGKPYRGAGVNFEITERRQAEQALRESEQRFRNLVEASALAVWETDPKGLVVVDNPSWRAFTGQTFEEIKGTGWVNAVHPVDRPFAVERWKEAIATSKNIDAEYRLRSAAGDYRWTNIKATPILDTEGRVTKWSGMNLDIHDQKQAEEALIKAKEEAEAASRAKEDFVSTMSHEIRTPLNAVIGITNLLLDQNPREDQKENLDSLNFSANNLLTLINDILDFSKLEAGKSELAENVFDLPDLLFSLQQAHQPQATAKGTELHLNLGKNVPQHISTDQLKLSQILHNLVSNAVKFTPEGQVNISVDLNRQDKEVLWLDFAIQDTGIGITADKLEHIFEKFTQAESSTVRQYGGTGLGLSITRLLLDLMGSEIKVKSKPGEGSSFYFCLPVKIAGKENLSEKQPETRNSAEDLRHIRLLLVEDVEINRKIITQFLQNWWQLQPDEATNGKEAVEKAKTRNYDLILMDVRMPVMDGYESTRQIRKLPGYSNIPILALTADKNQEEQQALQSTQFDDLLTKPFDPWDLKQKIVQHLRISDKENSVTGIRPLSSHPREEAAKSAEKQSAPAFEVSKYVRLAGGNREVLVKLLNNSLRAFETYKKEFSEAAAEGSAERLSELIHKNTTSVHYIQASRLAEEIEEYRKLLKDPAVERDELKEKERLVLLEFDQVITGLRPLKEKDF